MTRHFAAFDIDGTIFRWQLYHELFDAFVADSVIGNQEASSVLASRERWRTRQSSYDDYESTLIECMNSAVVGLEAKRFERIADAILQSKGQRTYRYTLDLLKQLKKQGYVIIAISGSYQQLVDRFALLHGIDIAVGKEYQVVDGVLTKNYTGVYGRKAEVLQELVTRYGLTLENSYGVGDSGGDIDMLRIVDHPIAFNPDKKLKTVATSNGWKIVIERKSISYELVKGSDGSYILA